MSARLLSLRSLIPIEWYLAGVEAMDWMLMAYVPRSTIVKRVDWESDSVNRALSLKLEESASYWLRAIATTPSYLML